MVLVAAAICSCLGGQALNHEKGIALRFGNFAAALVQASHDNDTKCR